MDYTISFGSSNSGSQVGVNYGLITNQIHGSSNPDDKLPIVYGAAFDSYAEQHEGECLAGTRTDILYQIREWAFSPSGRCIFWLNGMAGTGKSTIARTVARSLNEEKSLGASFFFKRGERDRGNAVKLFPTIATQLAMSISPLTPCLQKAVHDDPGIAAKGIREQFEKLLLQPLSSLERSDPLSRTLVIVIDALDECDSDNDTRLIIQLLPQLQRLKAVRLRVFLTGRPEISIRQGFTEIANQDHQDLTLHDIPKEVIENDISLFLNHRLAKIKTERLLPIDWPGKRVLERLVALSAPLFIFAATICRLLEDPCWDPVDSLREILAHRNDGSKLDQTYLPVLDRLLNNQNERQKEQLVSEFQQVIGPIVILESPLSITSLSKLLGLPEGLIHLRLNLLHSVLKLPDDNSLPVRLFHLSFRDFLLGVETRGKTPFWLDEKDIHYRVAAKCLVMCRNLRQNICILPSPGAHRAGLDRQVIDHFLPPELQYACRYWAHHLVLGKGLSDKLRDALSFLHEQFLHWIEAMSILGCLSDVIGIINLLQDAIYVDCDSVASEFLRDAKRFVLKNRGIADDAPLQIYCSGLVFAPHRSIMRREFESEIPRWILQLPKVEETWSSLQQTLELQPAFEDHHPFVTSVAFSPDGRLLACASDCTVQLWDPTTGALKQNLRTNFDVDFDSNIPIAFSNDGRLLTCASDYTVQLWDATTGSLQQIFEVSSGCVETVAFSPDGRLVTCASDWDSVCTVQLWDPKRGALQQTLVTHFGRVISTAFSPDGRLLAMSASENQQVLVWDAMTGALLQNINGHSRCVCPLAFSPASRLLACASEDRTLMVWDFMTGAVQQTIEDRSSSVKIQIFKPSMAFSPDGRLLASTSHKTVQVWDLTTGALQQTFEHPYGVTLVTFSPDGRLLASASDTTVRLWDVTTEMQQRNVDSHSDWVLSVAFSPDGGLLASASKDRTIRVWDPQTGTLKQILAGHSDIVNTVAFSPDGRLLASASEDQTIRIWDAISGVQQHNFEGYPTGTKVAFSPDGRLLAYTSRHRTIWVWDVITGVQQQNIEGYSSVETVAFSPDGRLLAAAYEDRTLRVWDTMTGELQDDLRVGQSVSNLFTPYIDPKLGYVNIQSWHGNHTTHPSQARLEIALLQDQWITVNGEKAMWLPPESRPHCSAIKGNTLVLGQNSGRVSFITLRAL